MHVIFWTEVFWPRIGGVEVFSKQLIAALRRRGHEFAVITSDGGPAEQAGEIADGIPIHRLPFQRVIIRKDLRQIRELTRRTAVLLQDFRPDLVHINSSQPSIFFYSLARAGRPIPTLYTLHEPLAQAQGANSLAGRLLRDADWVTAVSRMILSQARRLVPEIVPRSSVVYNGLEMPVQPVPDPPLNPPTLLCAGRLTGEKGFDLAIRALREIRNAFPTARLVIAGDGRDRQAMQKQSEALGLRSAVEFLGWCRPEDIPALIDAATMVLIPSRWQEPFGLIALQAAQRARPVIASRTGGLPEVVADEETGLLFEKDNAAELARQAIYLLRHPEIARRMGNAGRRRAQEFFGLERAAEAYDSLYRKLFRRAHTMTATMGWE